MRCRSSGEAGFLVLWPVGSVWRCARLCPVGVRRGCRSVPQVACGRARGVLLGPRGARVVCPPAPGDGRARIGRGLLRSDARPTRWRAGAQDRGEVGGVERWRVGTGAPLASVGVCERARGPAGLSGGGEQGQANDGLAAPDDSRGVTTVGGPGKAHWRRGCDKVRTLLCGTNWRPWPRSACFSGARQLRTR